AAVSTAGPPSSPLQRYNRAGPGPPERDRSLERTARAMEEVIPSRADVVVVGAGVVGTSIAYHLAARGCTDVVVLERNRIAQGASGDGAGGFRQQFSTAINVQMTRLSLPYFLDAPARLGADIAMRQQGYLFLLSNDETAEAFRANLAMQRELGA